MKSTMALLVTLAIVMLGVQLSEALQCYSCTTTVSGRDCVNSTAPGDLTQCNSTCRAYLTVLSTVIRGCGDAGAINKGCSWFGTLYSCDYICNTDLCNNQPPPTGSASHAAPTLAAVLALAICAIGFRAAA
jgi:hypothetical protein